MDALPPKFEMYTTLLRENPKFYEMTVEEAIGKVQAHDMNLKRKESSGRPQIQDPSMYYGTSSTTKSSGSGIVLFSGNSNEEDNSNGCGGHTCFTASGSGSHHQHPSRNPPSTSSANQTAIAKIAEDHVALFSSCMLTYENFIGGKLTDPETIEEDFNQVDPDDMEDMDIQWNMAMILRRAKRFLKRTGRKFIGGHSITKADFDKSKAKCYKCLNFGHFAHEWYNSNNRNQSQGGTSNALVAQQDESFDWGVHLEDALIAQTQVGLMAEIMEMMEAEEREASVADQVESTTAVALMAIGEASCSSNEVDSNPFAVISCSKCLSLKVENSKFQDKVEPLRIAALSYKENEKCYKDSIETLKKEKRDYSLKISDQRFHLDVPYKGLEKRNNEINKLQNEILQLNGKIEKLKNSRFMVEHYESVVRQVNGLGMGTNAIPPPVSGKFVNGLNDIDLSCLDESSSQDDSSNKDDSSSKADSASNEEFFTASDDGSENTCPEGVVSEELLCEQKVKKNIITDSDNSHFGLGYQENLQKFYIPKNQSSSGQTTIHQTTSPAHHAESSNARSNEPYKRTYKEKRTCFHCGMVGHILVNCPTKKQGKRPIVSQPAVIPKSPLVKHSKSQKENMVKPPVKPMVKPKITSEAKPSVSKKGKLPAKHSASTSGRAPTGEKPVVKLSKPQRRRRNKSLRKLEQLAEIQLGEASTSSPTTVESKSTVLVKKKKRSWNNKSKSSQPPGPKSSKDSSIFDSHDCELIKGHPKGTISNRWYVDRGCSRHMTGNMALLQDVKPFRGGYVTFAGEKGGSITCQGMVSNGCVSFDNVNYCEQLKHNLLSVSQMCDKEYSINMSMATTTSSVATCLLTKATELDSILWHRKLGHISYRKMNHLVRNGLVTGVPKLRFTIAYECMPCKKGKQQRKSHKPKLQNSIDTPLELLHMDLFGPISIRSIGGTKDEIADILQYLILSLESLCKLKVRRIRSDNGTEFKNNLMELFCLRKGIRHEFSAPYTPQQNGVAKRKNGTLIETVLVMSRNDLKWIVVNTTFHQNQLVQLGFDYDALFKSFNLPDLSADDAANVYELFGGGDDSSFSTRATVPIVTPDSNAASASRTHDSDNIEDVHVDGNNAQANPNTRVGNEAPADLINIESSSSGTQDMGETIAENTSLYSEILDTGVMETCMHAAFVSQLELKNVKEALADNCWIEAMQEELSQFQKLHV
ncbi:hypothetical protein L1987_48519 [Smallanthus sonchifolius]|uniref:Uncharacterized protein n=1 Tax=Smallanthus sonchifolius TaxID=185202 RepID=A0ACB9FRJ3_9ASTR|nr:hypothetical protein L1987_48519 [Smallanthus sonchifolius]